MKMKKIRKFRCKTAGYIAAALLLSWQVAAGDAGVGKGVRAVAADAMQDERITGVVGDRSGEPMAGVNVTVKGTTTGVVTDADGQYRITASPDAVLVFSYIGYHTQEIALGGRTTLNVVLSEDLQILEEVVVVGYGTQKKVNLSGAVQSVAGKALENRPLNNINSALQGTAANMNISNVSGRPNAAAEINIRGYTSINGGNAFILVDNVPMSAEEIARLNPADIESVSVLKDASASAIYGSRAAYGVVLITTRKAQSKELSINFDASYVMRKNKRLDYETSPEAILKYCAMADWPDPWLSTKIAYAEQITRDPSLPRIIDDPENPGNWAYYNEYEWYNENIREYNPAYTANLDISKNDGRLAYYVSGGYYRTDGIVNIENTDVFTRYNLRANATYALTKWWDVGTNTSFVTSDYEHPTALSEDFFFRMLASSTIDGPINPDGTYSSRGRYYALLREGGRKDTRINETRISVNTKFELLKDVWQVKADATYRFANTDIHTASLPVYIRNGPGQTMIRMVNSGFLDLNGNYANTNSFAQNEQGLTRQTVYNVYTDFHKTLGGKHFVQALAGYNQEYVIIDNWWVKSENLTTTSLPSIQLANGATNRGQDISDYALQGLFFRANYIFDDKYILEANGRYDGTSGYPAKKRWGFFPSGSAAWVVSREKFFESLNSYVDIFKLRTSYGALGNQTLMYGSWENFATGMVVSGYTDYYPYIPSMTQKQAKYVLNGSLPQGVYMPSPVSANQTWEKVMKLNIGTDLSFLKNRFDLSFDWYRQNTIGMLTKTMTLPAVFGAAVPRENAADLENKGWELTLGWKDRFVVANDPLSLSLRFMIADSKTHITKYVNPTRTLGDYYEGMEIGEIWGFVNDGFFQTDEEAQAANQNDLLGSNKTKHAGDLKYKNLDGDDKISFGENTVDKPGDREIIGNSEAHYPYSLDLNATWKGFDLRVFFYGIGKRDWYPGQNTTIFWGVSNAVGYTPAAVYSHVMDYWSEDNRDAYFPRPKFNVNADGEASNPQTKYLQDASYLRLKNLTLGYSLPQQTVRRWKLSNLRFYISSENLWTLSHIYTDFIDPEVLGGLDQHAVRDRKNNGYPLPINYSAGVHVSF
jgi:TonB-linked SusC/RagA family outer membrane protein